MIILQRSHRDHIFAYAREADPAECCGLIGGTEDRKAKRISSRHNDRCANVAKNFWPFITPTHVQLNPSRLIRMSGWRITLKLYISLLVWPVRSPPFVLFASPSARSVGKRLSMQLPASKIEPFREAHRRTC